MGPKIENRENSLVIHKGNDPENRKSRKFISDSQRKWARKSKSRENSFVIHKGNWPRKSKNRENSFVIHKGNGPENWKIEKIHL